MKKSLWLLVACVVSLTLAETSQAQVAYATYFSPAPAFVAPAPVRVTSFFAPAPAVAFQPVPVAYTRFRPLLGGTVTRFRTAYAPVVVAPTPVVLGF